MIAADLGFAADKIEFKTIASAEPRDRDLQSGQVDYYVGTYTINDERKKQVGFAGPYYMAGQDLLVRKDEQRHHRPGRTSRARRSARSPAPPRSSEIKKPTYGAKTAVSYDTYSVCVDNLLTGQVDAVTTDDAILQGLRGQDARASSRSSASRSPRSRTASA